METSYREEVNDTINRTSRGNGGGVVTGNEFGEFALSKSEECAVFMYT
jgi:hypothetical protein